VLEKNKFNRKVHKAKAKFAKLKTSILRLCDLCVIPLWPLRLMDLDLTGTS